MGLRVCLPETMAAKRLGESRATRILSPLAWALTRDPAPEPNSHASSAVLGRARPVGRRHTAESTDKESVDEVRHSVPQTTDLSLCRRADDRPVPLSCRQLGDR